VADDGARVGLELGIARGGILARRRPDLDRLHPVRAQERTRVVNRQDASDAIAALPGDGDRVGTGGILHAALVAELLSYRGTYAA